MYRFRLSVALTAAVLFAACTDSTPLDPLLERGPELRRDRPDGFVSVYNQNLYIGANVDAVIQAIGTPDPSDDVPALATALAELNATHFPTRAAVIADAIARRRPAVIGLQEVTTLDIVIPPLGADIHQDFLTILQDALTERGLTYQVAGSVVNVTATLPGISVVDRDVILVDPDRVSVTAVAAGNFAANLGEVVPGIFLVRGYVAVTATLGGRSIVFANTHLEPDLGGRQLALLRAAQAAELLAVIGGAERVVLMGDLNDVPGSPMHQLLLGAGFTDVWAALRREAPGLTCCHVSDLSNTRPTFDARIDYVLSRGIGHRVSGVQGVIARYGVLPVDRLLGPLHPIWPSDHAGLFATLLDHPLVIVDD